MIVSTIDDLKLYRPISEGLAMAIDWLREHRADAFTPGVYTIGNSAAGEVFAKYEEPALIPLEKADLEAHRRYIDIHVPLKGKETIGWAPVAVLKHVRVPYNPDTDICFYGDATQCRIHLKVGQAAVFFPEDAHAPNIGLGKHGKLCIKIPVQ